MKKQKPPVVSFVTRVISTTCHLSLPESSRNRVHNLVEWTKRSCMKQRIEQRHSQVMLFLNCNKYQLAYEFRRR